MTDNFKTGVLGDTGMKTAVRNLQEQGRREKMIIAVQTYLRVGMMTEFFFRRTLKSIGIEYADILILGWHNSIPFSSLMDVALKMKAKGLCRFIGISGHNRTLFPQLAEKKIFDIFQIRYNPAFTAADCYRFVLSNPHVDVCLCGPKNRDEMRQALTALDSGPFDAAETERAKAVGDHVHKTVKSFFA